MRKTKNLTKIHSALQKKPCTAIELQHIYPEIDKSVIYRTLQRLTQKGLLIEIMLDDGHITYELKKSGHHHHIICQECKSVFCVELPKQLSSFISSFENQLSDKFDVQSHRIDFFVICDACKKSSLNNNQLKIRK